MEAVWGYATGQSQLCKEYSNTDYPMKGKWKIHARERVSTSETFKNTFSGYWVKNRDNVTEPCGFQLIHKSPKET